MKTFKDYLTEANEDRWIPSGTSKKDIEYVKNNFRVGDKFVIKKVTYRFDGWRGDHELGFSNKDGDDKFVSVTWFMNGIKKKTIQYKETMEDHYQIRNRNKKPDPSLDSRDKAIKVITAIDSLVDSLDWNKELQNKAKALKLSAQKIAKESE